MKSNSPFCITFAGAPGSSKSPIANYLSVKFNLPVFNNDAIRKEVMEDRGGWNQLQIGEYEKRRNQRLQEVIDNGLPFIYDASADRNWIHLKPRLAKANYRWFIISLDLSEELLTKLYRTKNYAQPLEPSLLEHETFLKNHGSDIGIHITDSNFKDRLTLSSAAVDSWLRHFDMHVSSTMAIDIAFLLPAEVNEWAYEINQALRPNPAGILKFDDSHLPHLTILQQYVAISKLQQISALTEALLQDCRAITLQVPGIGPSNNARVCYWAIAPNLQLQQLHDRVVEALKPYRIGTGQQESFYRDQNEPIRQATMDYVANFHMQSSREHFDPHITLGFGEPDSGQKPFTFIANHMAICQLGSLNTCRKILFEYTLKR